MDSGFLAQWLLFIPSLASFSASKLSSISCSYSLILLAEVCIIELHFP